RRLPERRQLLRLRSRSQPMPSSEPGDVGVEPRPRHQCVLPGSPRRVRLVLSVRALRLARTTTGSDHHRQFGRAAPWYRPDATFVVLLTAAALIAIGVFWGNPKLGVFGVLWTLAMAAILGAA